MEADNHLAPNVAVCELEELVARRRRSQHGQHNAKLFGAHTVAHRPSSSHSRTKTNRGIGVGLGKFLHSHIMSHKGYRQTARATRFVERPSESSSIRLWSQPNAVLCCPPINCNCTTLISLVNFTILRCPWLEYNLRFLFTSTCPWE